jgi:hypothetical protein
MVYDELLGEFEHSILGHARTVVFPAVNLFGRKQVRGLPLLPTNVVGRSRSMQHTPGTIQRDRCNPARSRIGRTDRTCLEKRLVWSG